MPITINGTGPIDGITSLNTSVSSTELGFLDGVTSSIQTQLNSKPTGGEGAWIQYTPQWTASTTNPSVGNGTLFGKYIQIGKTVSFYIFFTSGTTTTWGSGQWRLTVPITMQNAAYANTFNGRCDETGVQTLPIFGYAQTVDYFIMQPPTSAIIGPTVPFTWAGAGDSFWIGGTYEAA